MDQPPTFASPINVSSLINNPPPSEAETPPIKRKRLTQACDACRKKKVKCSGEKPTCNNCTRLGTTCTYLPSTRKRGPRVGLVESLEKRLQQMEKLLQPLKEQGLVDDIDDKQTPAYSVKKPRLNNSADDVPFSRFGVDPTTPTQDNSVNYTRSALNVQNVSQFQQVLGYNDLNNQQTRSSYTQKEPYLFSQSQNESQINQLHTPNEQMINNDNSQKDEQNSNCSGKEDDGLIYFGKTSLLKPGFRHQSELACHRAAIVAECPNSDGSSSSGSSGENTPIINSPNSPNSKVILASGYPSLEIIEHLASCFFRYIDIQMSMFHEATFMRQLRQNKVSSFLVFAMCAVSSRYATHPSIVHDPPYLAGTQFASMATKMILQSFDYPSVEFVQAFILLALHMFGVCKGPRAWMYIGMAVRMAQEIGLHKIDEVPPGGQQPTKIKSEAAFIHKETRRRTFWACFLLDRYTACAVGRPTLIDEDDCDVRLPCNEAIWNYDHPFSKSLIEEYYKEVHVKRESRITLKNNGLCACFISAAALLGRVTQFVNRSKPPNSLPPWDPQSEFAILTNEIDMWYNSLSPHYTYNKERLQKLMANGTGVTFSLLHLLYYATVIVLNRPNIAILQNEEVAEPNVKFMRASAERCSAAAKMAVSISSDILQIGYHCFSPFTVYPLFVSTTVLDNDTYSSNISISEEAKRNLSTVENYLKTMSPYWAMGNKFICIINEMRKMRAEKHEKGQEKPNDVFNNLNPEQINEMSMMSTDAGLLAYWNRTNNAVAETNNNNNLGGISSIILPEEFMSPRWLGNFNDTAISNDTWTNFLRSPGPFTPKSLSRFLKKDKNSNGENPNENDYFSQDTITYNYPPPIFDGYPLIDMPPLLQQSAADWPTSNNEFLLNRPLKHWTSINGSNLSSESSSDGQSMSASTTASTTPNNNS
ncbi:fungal-specific transcription factor domain-containing protein [Glomus cerebriforme]|uniref:Fungal-specific transcription factor domain-containing protein n=1 Tax=Glomus cerebriforme TaxID=658196 RepID=A0A397SS09_9GLOM|nr:fungal-specific transcription factor domain-containing protein [Glomus cerebriforme]